MTVFPRILAVGLAANLTLSTVIAGDFTTQIRAYDITSARNPGSNRSYTGTVTFSPHGDALNVQWDLGDGSVVRGTGLQAAAVTAAVYGGSGLSGVAIYRWEDGRWRGVWTLAGDHLGRLGHEDWIGAQRLGGSYRLANCRQLDGHTPYSGSVTVTPSDDTFSIQWTLPDGSGYSGIGVLLEGHLVVGWTKTGSIGVVAYARTQGSERLAGIWTSSGAKGLGSEVLELRRQ